MTSATAACPSGSVRVGGGFATAQGSSGTVYPGNMNYYANRPYNDNYWMLGVINNSTGAQYVTAYAMCLQGTGASVSTASGSISIPAGGYDVGTAECPYGTTLASAGGYAAFRDTIALDFFPVYVFFPSGTFGAEAEMRNPGSIARAMTTYAVCLKF